MNYNLYLISGSNLDKITKQASQTSLELAGKQPDEFSYDVIQITDGIDYIQMLKNCLESLQTPSFFGTKTIWLKDFPLEKEPKATDKDSYAKHFSQLIELIQDLYNTNLIISGTGISRGKRLYKTINKLGKALIFDKIDMKDRQWQTKVQQEINLIAQNKKLQIAPQIIEFLIQLIGVDIYKIEPELEKLACHFYNQPINDLAKVQDLCSGGKQTAFWSLTNSLGKRDLAQSLDIINRFLTNCKNDKSACIGLLTNISNFFNQLLHCRLLMQTLETKSSQQVESLLKNLSEQQRATQLEGNSVINLHPYRLKMLCQDALKFSGKELININHLIAHSSRQLITIQASPRLILETLSTHISLG